MRNVKERFKPTVIPADTAVKCEGTQCGVFVATTGGTITITGFDDAGVNAVTFLNAFPVTAGVVYPLPFLFAPHGRGWTFTTAAGASGLLGV